MGTAVAVLWLAWLVVEHGSAATIAQHSSMDGG